MSNAEFQRMIYIAKAYYGNIEQVLSEDRLQEINSASGLMSPAPEGGEVRGLARSYGRIEDLLASPNMYPVGKGSHEIRSCVQCYDLLPATVNHNGEAITNGHLREMAIRKFWVIHDRQLSSQVEESDLAAGKHVERTHNCALVNCACLAIVRTVFGETLASSKLKSLQDMGRYPEYELAYYMMVLPLVVTLCTEMNPHMALDPRQILRKNLGKMENNIKTKLQRYGAWSEELAKYRLQLHFDHPMAINAFDEPMMSGIEFHFLRFYTVFVKGVSLPWDKRLRQHHKLWLTPAEKELLYVGYDDQWLNPRWPRPRQQGPNHFGF